MKSAGVGQYLQALTGVAWERRASVPSTEREALRQVAGQFEALFIQELLRSMRSTTLETGLTGNDRASKMYREMYDEAMSGNLATSGGFGIGRMLEEELARAGRVR